MQGVAVRGGGDMAVPAGVTVAGTARLRLVDVGPGRGGLYTCLASNQEGDGESNALALQVQCEYTFLVLTPVSLSASPHLSKFSG